MRRIRLAQAEAREQLIETSRASMGADDMIGCALRRDRLRRRESQRAYAARRGLSAAFVARLESRPGDLRFAAVLAGLEPTAYGLAVIPEGIRPHIATELIDLKASAILTVVRDFVAHRGCRGGSLPTR